jgi:hypothetical protein
MLSLDKCNNRKLCTIVVPKSGHSFFQASQLVLAVLAVLWLSGDPAEFVVVPRWNRLLGQLWD